MIETNYNPDVLCCLANLSNDEVFTPPSLVNEMLNLLPKEVWENKDLTFLDPVSKSGVFLREIAKRLIVGLEKQIPDIYNLDYFDLFAILFFIRVVRLFVILGIFIFLHIYIYFC